MQDCLVFFLGKISEKKGKAITLAFQLRGFQPSHDARMVVPAPLAYSRTKDPPEG